MGGGEAGCPFFEALLEVQAGRFLLAQIEAVKVAPNSSQL